MFFRFLVEKPIKRVIKESFLLFSRDKLILDEQVRYILFELLWLFLLLKIPLVLVFLSLVLMLVFKISKSSLRWFVDEMWQPES